MKNNEKLLLHYLISFLGAPIDKKNDNLCSMRLPKYVDALHIKMFRFLNQCFARLRFWKSVSDSRNLLDGATAVLLETLFQNRSRAKH